MYRRHKIKDENEQISETEKWNSQTTFFSFLIYRNQIDKCDLMQEIL